jgi:phage host-nuclease inhibitor protein Gam
MLTEETVQDNIAVVGDFRHVQVRTATVIKRDGVEISRGYSRHVVAPDADITVESAEVQDICNAVHTQAVKDAYAAHLASQQPEQEPASEENTD